MFPIDTPYRMLSKHRRETLIACRKAIQQLWSFYMDLSPDALLLRKDYRYPYSASSCILDPNLWPSRASV